MADGSSVATKDPSNRRRFYSEERTAPTGAITSDRPPEGYDVRVDVPSMDDVPLGREEGLFPEALTGHGYMEKSEPDLQFSGAIVAAGKISAPMLAVGVETFPGAAAFQMQGELVDRLAREIGLPLPGNTADIDYVSAAESEVALLAHLREKGRQPIADRIEKFLDLLAEDPDEGLIAVDSLRSLVSFVLMTPNLRTPIVGSDREGLMELEWHLADNGNPASVWGRGNGVVSLKFLTSGLIQYVALSGPHQKGIERLRKQGESTREYMLRSLGEFTPRITRA